MVTTTERIQLNRKTAAQWTAANTVLLAGEAGIELDTGRAKFGNGTSAWTALPYSGGATGGGGTGAVSSVAGRTGDVILTPADVQLGNVSNTSDVNKPVSTAQAAALALKVTAPTGGIDGQAIVKAGTGWALATISGATTPTLNSQTGTGYTLALTDADDVIEQNSASILTVTVPTNAAVGFPIGTVIEFNLYGTGSIVFNPATSAVLLRSPGNALRLTTRYASAAIRKRATDEWILSGALVV